MADEPVTPEEISEEERRKRALALSRDIAERYSPERLSKIVVSGAGRGEKLDLGTQQDMERRLGGKFDHVRVFRGPFAEAVTRQHRADAVTIGATGMILVREGPRSNPGTALGKALLAHELTHVRQAQRGMHFALEGGGSSNESHEAEAEAVEAQVASEGGGGGGGAHGGAGKGDGGKSEAAKKKKVMARVHELLEEHERTMRERLGLD